MTSSHQLKQGVSRVNTDKCILDACCGGRMMWFDRKNPHTLYIDIRQADNNLIEGRPEFSVQPDLIADFRDLPFADRTFKLIVWDPPHLKTLGEKSYMRKKYGVLNVDTWRCDLGKGFDELWRVLDDNGTLIFKWNETEIPLKEVLACFKHKPLFGHPTAKHGKTMWMCFFKHPLNVTEAEALRTPPNTKVSGIRAGDLL